MSLQDWVDNGWLRVHETKPGDIHELLKRADKNLNESYKMTGDQDWQFNIIYAAIINLANAALMAEGYRTRGGSHHYYAIESLELTINLDSHLVSMLDSFRKKRHIATYERCGVISVDMVEQILRITQELQKRVMNWLNNKHPDLLKN